MYDLDRSIEYDGLDDMKSELPEDIYNYVINNNLIWYDRDDIQKEYPSVERDDLPEEYIKRLAHQDKKIEKRDLYNYRLYMVKKLKELYPGVTDIEYITIDPIGLDPFKYGDDRILSMIQKEDRLVGDKTGIKLNFRQHFTETFQDFIQYSMDKFDVVWFMTCTNFHYVIDMTNSYIANFRRILDPNGIIIHMDWDGKTIQKDVLGRNQPVSTILPIESRHKILPSEYRDWESINFLTKRLTMIQPGIYRFKNNRDLAIQTLLF
jgi:hypothetical protein